MQLKECYEAFGGSYESVRERIPNDEMIAKFVLKFLSEPSYGNLCNAVESSNVEEAFRAAHSLKGICANLGFPVLGESSSVLTEYLRGKDAGQVDKGECAKLLEKVTEDYNTVITAIKTYLE